jgi:hypothetical protein
MYLFLVATSLLVRPSAAFSRARSESTQALQQEINELKRDFDALKQQYGSRLAALESKMAQIQNGGPTVQPLVFTPAAAPPQEPQQQQPQQPAEQVPPGAAGAGGPSGQLPVYGGAGSASKVFNPDMAVIGDFLGAAGSNKVNPAPALEMHESEAAFQAIVDPYARADFFVAFGEEGVELEEGFLTFPAIPGGLLVKVGKLRAAFGKVNTLHNHVLPWTDRPLVTNNLMGGEEGISDAGFSLAKLITNPWIFLEATGQVFRGDSDDLFRSSKRGDLCYVGHLRGYQDLTDNTNIDLGFSYSRGHNDSGIVGDFDLGRFRTTLYGADATIRWRPLQRSIYHSLDNWTPACHRLDDGNRGVGARRVSVLEAGPAHWRHDCMHLRTGPCRHGCTASTHPAERPRRGSAGRLFRSCPAAVALTFCSLLYNALPNGTRAVIDRPYRYRSSYCRGAL